jgi:hypothetical protein
VLASPPGILQNQRRLRIFENGTTEFHRLENFQNPGNVTVAVDAIVFESGQFVGANQYGAFEQWQERTEEYEMGVIGFPELAVLLFGGVIGIGFMLSCFLYCGSSIRCSPRLMRTSQEFGKCLTVQPSGSWPRW